MSGKTGRSLFHRYASLIHFLIMLYGLLPKCIRRALFNAARNQNGSIGFLKRYVLLSTLAVSVGDNVAIYPGVFIENPDRLEIGSNVSIHQMCYLDAAGGMEIGSNVSIAHRSTLLSSSHTFHQNDVPIKYQKLIYARTVICDNVWIGCNCVVLAGVEVARGCVIGANTLLNRSTEPDGVYAGSPGKRIKDRLPKEKATTEV